MLSSRRLATLIAVVCLGTTAYPQAAIDWNGATTGSTELSAPTSWTNGSIVNDTSSTIGVFGNVTLSGNAVLGNSSYNLAGLRFATGAGNFIVSAVGNNTLSLGTSGVENLATTGVQSISVPLVFDSVATIRNAGSLTISGTVANAQSLTLDGAGISGGITGAISGNGSITKDGSGTWVLGHANTYLGNTVVDAGTLSLTANNALPVDGVVSIVPNSAAGATLDVGNTTQTIGTLNFGGVSASSAMVTLGNAGVVTLDGNVVYSAANNPGAANITGGTLVLSGTRTFTVGSSTATGTGGADLAISSKITGAGGVTKAGAGLLELSGANDYAGATTVTDGRLRVSATGALPSGTNVVINTQTTGGTAVLDLGGTTQTIGNLTLGGVSGSNAALDLGPGGTVVLGGDVHYDATNGPGGAMISNGNAVDLGSATRTFNVEHAGNTTVDLTISTPIAGNVGITKMGAGTLVLTGVSTYTGVTTVNAGTLQIGNGSDGMIVGDIQNSASLVFSRNNDPTYAGVISGTGTVTTLGDMNITGANTYSGNTTIASGTLIVANTAQSGTGTGAVFISPNATLQIGNGGANGAVAGNILNSGAVVVNQSSNYTYSGVISGTGHVEKLGAGTLTLSNANTYQGETDIWEGTVKLGVDNALPSSSILNLASSATLEVAGNQTLRQFGWTTAGAVVIDSGAALAIAPVNDNGFSGNISGAGNLIINAGPISNLVYNGTLSLSGATVVTSGTFDVSNSGQLSSAGALVIKPLNGSFASVYIGDNGQTVGSLYFGGSGTQSGGQALLEMDSGDLTLNGNVTFDETSSPRGAMIVGAGTLHLGNADRTFTIGHSTNAMADLWIEPALSGSVNLTKAGAGSLFLGSSASSFTGNITVAAGSLFLGDDNATGTGLLTMQSGTVLGSIGLYTSGGIVGLSNSVALNDNVTFGSPGFSDGVTLNGNVTVPATATLHVGMHRPVTLAGAVTGSNSALTFDGGGTLVLGGSISSVSTITASGAAVIVTSPSVLSTSGAPVFKATGGYVGIGAPLSGTTPNVADLVSHIDKANFNGTFGFDTTPGVDHPTAHAFGSTSDPLDFSAFNSNLTLGSTSLAILQGPITPPSTATDYRFGNGGGVLVVQSDLNDTAGRPLGLSVDSATSLPDNSLGVVLQGTNTFRGNVAVANSALIFDSAQSLPATATINLGASGYVGATDTLLGTAPGAAFSSFLSRIGSYTGTSVVGLDSSANIADHLAGNGTSWQTLQFCDTINLRPFNSIYLGTVTNADVSGQVLGPQGGTLSLVSLSSGSLTIRSNLHVGSASQVAVGSTTIGDEKGSVVLAGSNSYTGGTTLASGQLVIQNSSVKSNGTIVAGPLGTGTLTVANGASKAVLVADGSGPVVLHNPISLGSTLLLGALEEASQNVSTFNNRTQDLVLAGDISGSGGLVVNSSVLLAGNNSFSGGVDVEYGTLGIASDSALGTGSLRFGGQYYYPYFNLDIANGPRTVANDVYFIGSGSQYAELQITGTAGVTFTHPVNIGVSELDIQVGDYPVYFNNAVNGFGSLRVSGGSALILNSTANTYTGGTWVHNGAVVFGDVASIPNTGLLQVTGDGYIGLAATPANDSDLQSKFLDRFDKAYSNGTIGFDSLSGTPNTFAGAIDLSQFDWDVRLGSSTAAVLNGTITPQDAYYNFGGGGGVLTVNSNLVDATSESQVRNLEVWSPASHPLTLIVAGANNTYSGETRVGQSAVVFNSLPANAGTFRLDAGGYIGLRLAANATGTDAVVTSFVSHFDAAQNNGYLGFDNGGGNSVTDLNLGGMNTNVGLSTTSLLHVAGNYTAPDSTNYRLAGYKGGQLFIDSVLGGNASVTIGDTDVPATFGVPNTPMAISSVTLNGNNTYSGGTLLNAGNLYVGNDHALGSGGLTVAANIGNQDLGIRAGLLASSSATLTNAITVNSDLNIGGPAALTLSGVLSGGGELYKVGGGMLTLSGTNSLSGGIYVQQGDITFASGTSVGDGPLQFGISANSSATFLDSSTVNGISADSANDSIVLTAAKSLTVNQNFDAEFMGKFTGSTSGLTLQGSNKLKLSGASTFTGPVTIQGGVAVLAANNNALGQSTNAVAVNGAKLAVAGGVTIANPITVTNGALGGTGTFQATSTAGVFTIGSGSILAPGMSGPGTLHFDGSLLATSVLVLAGGGGYHWQLTDAANASGGWDLIAVNGAVSITADSVHPFDFSINSIAPDGSSGFAANFDPSQPYSWTVLTATSITGFTGGNQFALTGAWLNPNSGSFSLGMNSTNTALMLNFSPVPEPSTYALMLTGLGAVLFAWRRRRR